MLLKKFTETLDPTTLITQLQNGLIGEGIEINTAFGTKNLIYADYTASGRALIQVENFIAQHVLPYYANSHTEASYCGAYITKLREEARDAIADLTNANPECSVIFSGSGATSAINRLVSLCGITEIADAAAEAEKPVVFIGPYEHHSNILPWRESGAEVIEIGEANAGGPNLKELEERLTTLADRPLLIGAFSAASNVTGICSDVSAVTRILKKHGALAFWDYAGAGPYLPIDMNPNNEYALDAVVLSPHKFPGGPAASGLLILRNSIVRATRPTWPGGGTVTYVSPWAHNYSENLTDREEAGTPNIIGDIRAALVMLLKQAVGTDTILSRDAELAARAQAAWQNHPNITILGVEKHNRLPIFSFLVHDDTGEIVHHQLFTRMLSDIYGIQVRGGCVCAGPYGHRLLQVSKTQSETIRHAVLAGEEIQKPGWIRLNFNYLMPDETVSFIIQSVAELARDVKEMAKNYSSDNVTAEFQLTA